MTSVKCHRVNLIGLHTLTLRGCMFDNSNADKSDYELARYFPTYFEASRSWVMQIFFIGHEKDLGYS